METEAGFDDTYNDKILEIAEKTGEQRGTVNFYIDRFSKWVLNPDPIDDEDNLVRAYVKLYNKYGSKIVARAEVGRRIKLAREIRKLREMVLENHEFGTTSAWDTLYTSHIKSNED